MLDALPRSRAYPALERLLALARALTAGRRVWLSYRDAGGEETEREVDPLALSWGRGQWLLAAWCRRRRAFRLFRVERIASARTLARASDAALVPSTFDPRFFASASYLESGSGPPVLATVRLRPPLDELARALFPAALFEQCSETMVLCHLRTTDQSELANLVISLGQGAEIVHPSSAREILRELRTTPS